MKYASLVVLLVAVLALSFSGCASHNVVSGNGANAACPPDAGGQCPNGAAAGAAADPMPPSGVVAYPYYTLRGPRDFLARNPRPIGP